MSDQSTLKSNPCSQVATNVGIQEDRMRVLNFSSSSWDMALAYNEHGSGKEIVEECYEEIRLLYESLK